MLRALAASRGRVRTGVLCRPPPPTRWAVAAKSSKADRATPGKGAKGLEALFHNRTDPGTYEVTVFASSRGSHLHLYTAAIAFTVSFALFWTADRVLIMSQSLLLWMGSVDSLEPYVMETVGGDSVAVRMLGVTCVAIAGGFGWYMYRQYVGRQIKELTVVRRAGDVFLRLIVFRIQGAPRVLEFPITRVSCPQLEAMPLNALELNLAPDASFRAFTLKIQSEAGLFDEGFWIRRGDVAHKKALWQLFNQDRTPAEHNVWLHFLHAKKPDPALFPCQ